MLILVMKTLRNCLFFTFNYISNIYLFIQCIFIFLFSKEILFCEINKK